MDPGIEKQVYGRQCIADSLEMALASQLDVPEKF